MKRHITKICLFTMVFLKALLLHAADMPQSDAQNQMHDLLECPKEETPTNVLRENDSKKLPTKALKILDEMQSEFKKMFSIDWKTSRKNEFTNSHTVKRLNVKVVLWHFSFFIEDALHKMKQLKISDAHEGIVADTRKKMVQEWETFFVQNDVKNNSDKEVCLLQGFVHRIIRSDILNRDKRWATFAQQLAIVMFSIDVGPTFGKDNFTTLTEEEAAEHAKKCDEFEYSANIVNRLLAPASNHLLYRLCIQSLIFNSEEFQHYLCHHKNIDNYKESLYYLMGRHELYALEEIVPYIMHIEQISDLRCIDGHHDQFQYRTGTENAIAYEVRIAIRNFLGDAALNEREKSVRHQAAKGKQFGAQMLRKINAVKKAVLAPDAVVSPKGICMLIKLREFLTSFYHDKRDQQLMLLEDDAIDQWWPSECDRREEAESMFRIQHFVFHEHNRKMLANFMLAWRELVAVRGAATRVHKFLQMSEREIELEWAYGDQYTDQKVFRSHELLETHYIDAIAADDPTQQGAMKLAADVWAWVSWLEKDVLELAEYKTKFKLPRLTMAWKQNRWYYEMVYDQLFDIEKADEEAELEKKRHQIGILLQMSKAFVEQKLKMPDEKLRVELRNQKLGRLRQREGGTASPQGGTVDREWYEIRRRSESRKGQQTDGEEGAVFQKWLQQRHFKQFTAYLSKCYTFNAEFIKKSLGKNKLPLAQIVGEENAHEIYEIAINFFGTLQKSDDHCHESDKSSDENVPQIEEKSENEEKQFDVKATMALLNLEEEPKMSKTPRNGTKNRQKNKQTNAAKKNMLKNLSELEISANDRNTDSTEQKSAEAKPPLASPTEIFLSPREQFSDQEPQFKTPLNSPNVAPKLEDGNVGILPTEEKAKKGDEKLLKSDREETASKAEREKEGKKGTTKKSRKIKGKKSSSREREEEEEEEEEEKHGGKSKGRSSEGIGTITTASSFSSADNDNDNNNDNEKGWQLFLDDDFLVKSFRRFFVRPTELRQQIVSIGCQINEIGHRMELINKLHPIGDQKMLKELIQRGIAPSKWMYKNLKQHWQQIKKEKLSLIGNEMLPLFNNDPNDDGEVSLIKNSPMSPDKFGLITLRPALWKQLKMIAKFADINSANSYQTSDDDGSAMDFVGKQIILRKMALALLADREHFHKTVANLQIGTSNLQKTENRKHLELFWHKLSEEKREKIGKTLFGDEFDRETFAVFMDHFLAMIGQNEQDQKLAGEVSAFTKMHLNFLGISLHLQEIKSLSAGDKKLLLIGSDSSATQTMLSALLSTHGFGPVRNDRMMQIDQAIRTIGQTAQKWNPKAKLLVTGSYQLGVLTDQSDIDAICVVPANSSTSSAEAPQFVGNAKCQMGWWNSSRICQDSSLFCQLCLLSNVISIRSIPDVWAPLIELTFKSDPNTSIEFDIGFATFEHSEDIFQSKEPIKYEQSDALSRKMAHQIEELAQQSREGHFGQGGGGKSTDMELRKKLRSLSAFEVDAIILNKLLSSEQRENGKRNILSIFRTFLLAIKMWAKAHHIYDNKLGFFNGISLSILVAKVMLLYPMASLPFLVEKFFLTFSTWPWPTPVKLTDLPDGSALRWTPGDEKIKRNETYASRGLSPELAMPIVTPGHIEQNATFNVNPSTATIIQRELQNAMKSIRNWPNLTVSNEAKWESLLKDQKFEEKYAHFIRVTCAALSLADFYDFCGFVELRIRLQLLMDVEPFEHIRLAHAKQIVPREHFSEVKTDGTARASGRGGERGAKACRTKASTTSNNKTECYRKIWLVGLEMDDTNALEEKDGSEVEKSTNWADWTRRLDSMLAHLIDANIEKAYRRKKNLVNDKGLQIELRSRYEKKTK